MAGESFATTDLCDEFGDELAVCDLQFRQFGGRREFAGPVRTVRCYEDNVRMRELIDAPGDGAVVIVDGGGSLRCALLGDHLAEVARGNGWSGFVVVGAVRDSRDLAAIDIGVKALGTNPSRSAKVGAGVVDEPVALGSVVVRPGDHLWVDDDGIVVAGRELADRVLAHLGSSGR